MLILFQLSLSTQSDGVCNVTAYPHDYFRILPPMVPYNFTETYEVIEISNTTGAKCLDGSNYKFFFTKGVGAGLHKFMFLFQGAGFCGSDGNSFLASCLQRTTTEFGSSSEWGENGTTVTNNDGLGWFSSDETYNPKFWDWNKIVVKYCDGSNNQGYLEDPILYEGTNLWFRGHNNTYSMFEYARTHFGLFDATDVIVTGSSSGGVASMIWIQFLADYLPMNIKLLGMPDGALFLDFYNELANCYLFRYNTKVLSNFTNSQTLEVFKNCEFFNTSSVWKCMAPQYFYQSIKSPMFITNAIYDCEELTTTYGIPCIAYGADTCSNIEKKKLVAFRQKFLKVLLDMKENKPKWGFWARSCFEHVYYNTWAWYGETMNTFSAELNENQSLKKAMYEWYENLDNNFNKYSFIDLLDWQHNSECVKYKNARNPI